MKKFSVFAIIVAVVFSASCEFNSKDNDNDDPIVKKPLESGIYIGGQTWDDTYVEKAGYWKDNTWIGLSLPGEAVESYVTDIKVYDNDLYAAGYYLKNMGGIVTGYWKNGEWTEVSNNTFYNYDNHKVMIEVSAKSVYITDYSKAWLQKQAGYWNNGEWIALESPNDNAPWMSDICLSGDDMYISSSSPAGYWKNGKWTDLAGPVESSKGASVNSLYISGNDVYAFGYIYDDADNYVAGYWKNGDWNKLSTPYTGVYYRSQAVSAVFSGSDLYVSGDAYVSGEYHPGYWKNGEWVELFSLNEDYDVSADSISVIAESDVVVAGYSCLICEEPIPGTWKNGEWSVLSVPEGSIEGWPSCMTIVE